VKNKFDLARETRKPAIRELLRQPIAGHQHKIHTACKDIQRELGDFFCRHDSCTARDMAWIFEMHFTHKQIKRWVVAFLPRNPTGQHSGISRRFGFQEAACIASGGIMVAYYRLDIQEAKMLLEGK
jgi:hypothetical protein